MRALIPGLLAGIAAAQADPAALVRAFAPFDLDGDGVLEVRRLEPRRVVGEEASPLVLVLVEERLVPAADAGAGAAALAAALETFAADVAAGGFRALLATAELHHGPPHQDGRTLLALRRLCQRLHAALPLAGVVLVGRFPDALLVRTCHWRRQEELSLPGRDGAEVAIPATMPNVRCVPEIVAHRCDLVLADLDGDWERVYVPGPTALPSVTVVFGDDVPDAGGEALAIRTGELAVVDAFHVRDGAAVVDRETFAVRLDADDRDHECSAADRARGNPLARPEIAVSRLDARGVALRPDPRALDAAGRPQAVSLQDFPDGVPWRHDLALERQLLVDYFARNHRFRAAQPLAEAHRPAAISHGLGAGFGQLREAAPQWRDFAEAGYAVHEHADLVAFVRWLQRPAVLRTMRVHSDPFGGEFAAADPGALAAAAGDGPWHWRRDGERWAPSWTDHANGRADFAFYRTLWQRRLLPEQPFLLLHTGCEALSPPHSVASPHDDPAYGERAHAESILFYTPCLTIVGRAKVFYDEPRGFAAALGEGRTIGEAWQRYFEIESMPGDWNEVGGDIGRKRAYFWSVVGDWTLRLPRLP